MNLGTTRALRGPNIWSQLTVLEVEIDFSAHLLRSLEEIDGICDRAAGILSGPSKDSAQVHPLDEGREGAVETGLRTCAMRLSELFARTTLRMQQDAGCVVKFARVAETKSAGICKVAVQY